MANAVAASPYWQELFISWMHSAAFLCAFIFATLRVCIRFQKEMRPCFQTNFIFHDAMAGFTIPSFFALILSYLSPSLLAHVDSHSALAAGILGVTYTLGGVLKGGH